MPGICVNSIMFFHDIPTSLYWQEMEASEKLRIAKHSLELVNDKMAIQLEEMAKKLQFAEQRGPQLEGADSKSWKSIVVTR